MAHARTTAELNTRRQLEQNTVLLADLGQSLRDIHETQRRGQQ